jgi:hypothetical protein
MVISQLYRQYSGEWQKKKKKVSKFKNTEERTTILVLSFLISTSVILSCLSVNFILDL